MGRGARKWIVPFFPAIPGRSAEGKAKYGALVAVQDFQLRADSMAAGLAVEPYAHVVGSEVGGTRVEVIGGHRPAGPDFVPDFGINLVQSHGAKAPPSDARRYIPDHLPLDGLLANVGGAHCLKDLKNPLRDAGYRGRLLGGRPEKGPFYFSKRVLVVRSYRYIAK